MERTKEDRDSKKKDIRQKEENIITKTRKGMKSNM